MADRHGGSGQTQKGPPPTTHHGRAFLRKLFHEHSPNPSQLIGLLTLIISGGILLILTGLTVTTTVLGLILFTPILFISSPIWVPVAAVLIAAFAGILSTCGFGVATAAAMSWIYKYYKGLHPFGSDRVDYARSRIADTAGHVKDYAKEYGGYLHGKVKDAAPGA